MLVRTDEVGSGPGPRLYACPAHARAYAATPGAPAWLRRTIHSQEGPPTGRTVALISPTLWAPPDGPGAPAVFELDLSAHLDVVETPADLDVGEVLDGFTQVPHILNPGAGARYWLIPRGSSTRRPWDWRRLARYVSVHTGPYRLAVPHAETVSGPGPHWVHPSDHWSGQYVADPMSLALDLGPATLCLGPPGSRCHLCRDAVWPDEEAWIAPAGAGIFSATRAHPACARAAGYRPVPGRNTWQHSSSARPVLRRIQ